MSAACNVLVNKSPVPPRKGGTSSRLVNLVDLVEILNVFRALRCMSADWHGSFTSHHHVPAHRSTRCSQLQDTPGIWLPISFSSCADSELRREIWSSCVNGTCLFLFCRLAGHVAPAGWVSATWVFGKWFHSSKVGTQGYAFFVSCLGLLVGQLGQGSCRLLAG